MRKSRTNGKRRDAWGYRRSVPVTTKSTSWPPHPQQTSHWRQSRTGVSAPYRATSSAGSGSTWWPHALHHTINRTFAFAALPSVIGGPGGDFISLALRYPRSTFSGGAADAQALWGQGI